MDAIDGGCDQAGAFRPGHRGTGGFAAGIRAILRRHRPGDPGGSRGCGGGGFGCVDAGLDQHPTQSAGAPAAVCGPHRPESGAQPAGIPKCRKAGGASHGGAGSRDGRLRPGTAGPADCAGSISAAAEAGAPADVSAAILVRRRCRPDRSAVRLHKDEGDGHPVPSAAEAESPFGKGGAL